MKVGIYIHDYRPISGGGYTFQREILEAIIELAPQTKHRFSILTYDRYEPLGNENSPAIVNIVHIEKQPKKLSNYFSMLLQMIKTSEEPFYEGKTLSPLDFTAVKNNIDFIWFVTPAYELTNVPYLATIWDLQHRLQPWFPEVGNQK